MAYALFCKRAIHILGNRFDRYDFSLVDRVAGNKGSRCR